MSCVTQCLLPQSPHLLMDVMSAPCGLLSSRRQDPFIQEAQHRGHNITHEKHRASEFLLQHKEKHFRCEGSYE